MLETKTTMTANVSDDGPDQGVRDTIAALVARARAAQQVVEGCDQRRVDDVVDAIAWAIVEPGRARALAELAVRATGLGNVEDKVDKNRRKTLGTLRDLFGAPTVGVIAEGERAACRRRRCGRHPQPDRARAEVPWRHGAGHRSRTRTDGGTYVSRPRPRCLPRGGSRPGRASPMLGAT